MKEFLISNAAGVFALLGTIFGGATSFLGARAIARAELRLRLREKVLDRRIDAHERIVRAAKTMSTMVVVSYDPRTGDLPRAPYFFADPDAFQRWYGEFVLAVQDASTWLAAPVARELYVIQNYLVNLDQALTPVPPERYMAVGAILRVDFLEFSERLERLAFEFFEKDLDRLRLHRLSERVYDVEEARKRLDKTAFRTRGEDLTRAAQIPNQPKA